MVIPRKWRRVRVAFISKAGGRDVTFTKSFRTISLIKFLLKIVEKAVDNHLRTGVL